MLWSDHQHPGITRRLILVAAVVIVGVLAFGATDATAHNKLFRSQVKVSFHVSGLDSVFIHGVVKSKKRRCKVRRKVTVFAVRRGERDPEVGKARTNRKGEWWIDTSTAIVSNRYKAKIGSVKKFGRQKNHGCTTDVGLEGVT